MSSMSSSVTESCIILASMATRDSTIIFAHLFNCASRTLSKIGKYTHLKTRAYARVFSDTQGPHGVSMDPNGQHLAQSNCNHLMCFNWLCPLPHATRCSHTLARPLWRYKVFASWRLEVCTSGNLVYFPLPLPGVPLCRICSMVFRRGGYSGCNCSRVATTTQKLA